MRAIVIETFGGPEVLQVRDDVPEPVPERGQELLDVSSAGINYADTHAAANDYLSPQTLPFIPGSEVVGRRPDGARVASFTLGGGYAERALVHPGMSFAVPEGVSDGQALALLVQGLTAWHLLRTSTRLAAGESVVVHAAAGGVGTLAVQLAKAWGAGTVIGVASTAEKRALAASLGADVTVDANEPDLKAALEQANDGRKVDVVLEMVGGATLDASLAAMAPFGRLAAFGMASRQPPTPITSGALMSHSRAVIGFWLAHAFARPEMLQPPMAELLSMVEAGTLRPVVGGTYPLREAHRAHEDLLSRASHGKLVLDCRR
ncbi:MAG: NADPH:quinone oxidoreductase family protein [Actinobacteria bacterium]|nr:NADPH:quinone oxidoreductase family protein [Actinomycetota bacterium]